MDGEEDDEGAGREGMVEWKGRGVNEKGSRRGELEKEKGDEEEVEE